MRTCVAVCTYSVNRRYTYKALQLGKDSLAYLEKQKRKRSSAIQESTTPD